MKRGFQPPRGMRDFLPQEMIPRTRVIEIIKNTFERYGFLPMMTPAVEHYDTLSVKGGGGEAIKDEIYVFNDKSGRKLGLRYDLTVPTARVVANNSLTLPFKRYQIGRVWRYDRPQKGRYREFWQCDVDVIGSNNVLSDAECVACVMECLQNLGLKKLMLRINNRKLSEELMRAVDVPCELVIPVFRAIDKLDKIGVKGVKKELENAGLDKRVIDKIIKVIDLSGEPSAVLERVQEYVQDSQGAREIKDFLTHTEYFGINSRVVLDLSLVRGLEYYTGMVFEISPVEKGIGSIGGGGRYDKLLSLYGKDLPAVGVSIGLDRLMVLMKEKGLLPRVKTVTKVFLVSISASMLDEVIKVGQVLRDEGINCEIDLMNRSLSKQLSYVNSQRIPYAVLFGEKEYAKKQVVVKNMITGKEEKVSVSDLPGYLKQKTKY